jgi:hypothetical protein
MKKCKIMSPDPDDIRWVKFCSSYDTCKNKDINENDNKDDILNNQADDNMNKINIDS